MNFAAVLLICANLVIMMTSISARRAFHGMPIDFDPTTPRSAWDVEYTNLINECKQELNLTDFYYTTAMFMSNRVPTKRKEGCMLDCMFYRMGRLIKKENSEFNEYAFPPVDPNMDPRKEPSQPVKNIFEAVIVCKLFLERHRIEKCNLIYQYRDCVSKVLGGLLLVIPPNIRN